MHLDEYAAPSGSSQMQFSINFKAEIIKELQLLFATTFPLKLHHCCV